MKSKIVYKSFIANHIREHVELKQSLGYKYITEAKCLKRFDSFIVEQFPDSKTITKEIVMKWSEKVTYESEANRNSRTSMIRQFCIYLRTIGIETYILPKGYFSKEKQYIPHIYTIDELSHFFNETDKCKVSSECPCRHLIMPLYFRVIYSCGLRPVEARLLETDHVDLDNGIITIVRSKNDNDRIVPLPDSLLENLREYSNAVRKILPENKYFFPGINGKPMTATNTYHNFRRFLWRARIPHGGRGKGPRIMDFRHTFACHCLKKWVEEEKDLNAYLPILKTFMGHYSFSDTAYYLHLTADVFPDITIKLEGCYSDLIPTLEGDHNEAN